MGGGLAGLTAANHLAKSGKRVLLIERNAYPVHKVCGEYLSKGRQVYIEGKLQTREWEDQEGNKRWTTEIVARDMQMLGSRDQTESFSEGYAGGGQAPATNQSPTEDDIPF